MSRAVIAGQFVRFSSLSDGSLRLVIDVPHEYAHDVLATLGFPAGQSVAVALLSEVRPPSPTAEESRPSTKMPDSGAARPRAKHAWERTPWHELSRSKQAAIRCSDTRFAEYLQDYSMTGEMVANTVRRLCRVNSRAEFDVDPQAAARWEKLDADYRRWAGLETEPRG